MAARLWKSTAGPVVALALLAGVPAGAQTTSDGRFPVTESQRRAADQVAQAGVPLSALAPTAPDSYAVKRGDTLWGIASLFLTSPWRWPELWGMNKEQVRNPHLIYPGQTLRLVRTSDGRARLEIAGGGLGAQPGGVGDTVRLSPRTRETEVGRSAIPSIPNHLIEPFLSQPLVVAADGLDAYPRIVATQEGRVLVGRGDTAYARGIVDPAVNSYNVFRPARPLFDPDDTERRRPIAFEAFFLGTAAVTKPGEVATLSIIESKQEIGIGDRLIPVERLILASYVPRRPQREIEGRIVAVYGGLENAAGGSVVTLNRGAAQGLEVGDVLALLQTGAVITDRTETGRAQLQLPDERIGEMFVFRVFDHIAYALIVRSTVPVTVGDSFTQVDDSFTPRRRAVAPRALDVPARTRLDDPADPPGSGGQ
jgi:LysM repeat protein